MMVTAKRIPVPLPIAPKKSATTVKAPMHIPPNAAATGIYLSSSTPTTITQSSEVPSHSGVQNNRGQKEAKKGREKRRRRRRRRKKRRRRTPYRFKTSTRAVSR